MEVPDYTDEQIQVFADLRGITIAQARTKLEQARCSMSNRQNCIIL
jgi:hypothetical protein